MDKNTDSKTTPVPGIHSNDLLDADICGLCGQPGADKYKHHFHWPGETNPEGELVHAECEKEECQRAHQEFWNRVGEDGVRAFLRGI